MVYLMLVWEQVTNAVNAVPPIVRTVAEVKKNWFDLKVMPKKSTAAHKGISTTGKGHH